MNFTLMIILVLFAIVVTMGGIIYVIIKQNQDNKKEIKALIKENEIAHENVKQLTDYIRNADKIKKEEKQITEKIKEAKTDEEIYSIINNIIAINNSRVQND